MPLSFDLRPASKSDLEFCWPIYRDAQQPLMAGEWHEPTQRRLVEHAISHAGTSIIRSEGGDAGWLHVEESGQIIALKQFVLVPAMRNRGVGTAFLNWMKERADRKRKDLNVEFAAGSPARHLLERLGFKPVPGSGPIATMRY